VLALSGQPKSSRVVVLFDARICTPLRLDLPPLSKHKQAQALRWAAEEYVAGSMDQEHVVAGPRDSEGQLLALTIATQAMDRLCTALNPLSPEALVPDALCLPLVSGECSLAAHGQRILMRWGQWEFGSFSESTALVMLEQIKAPVWAWYGNAQPPASLTSRVTRKASDADVLTLLGEQALQVPINVLTGPWQSALASETKGHWAWVAGLSLACLVLAVGHLGIETRMLTTKANELRIQVEEVFGSLFPGQPGMGRERELVARELARLQYGQARDLLELMARIGPIVAGQSGVVVESMNYRDQALRLDLQAPDVATLDSIGRQLSASDLESTVESATLSADGARGQISVRGQ